MVAQAPITTPQPGDPGWERPSVWVAFAWGLASAASLPVGAGISMVYRPPEVLKANMMAFGGGALLFALAIELFGAAIHEKPHHEIVYYNTMIVTMAGAALGGSLVFTGLDHALSNAGAFLRKFSTLNSARSKDFLGNMLGTRTISALQATHIFRNIHKAELERLLPHMQHVTFRKGELAISDKIVDDDPLYFVVSGSVRLVYCNEDGESLPLGARTIARDQIFGHDAITVGAAVRCRAVCETKTVCLAITPFSLERVLFEEGAIEGKSTSIQNIVNSREDHDVPVASVVGAEPEALFEEGALSTLSSAQKKQLFDSMFQEIYFEGEEIFHKLDSMSPMYYIVSGRVRLTENGNISWRDSGMLLGAEVLDIAAGRNGPRMQEAVAMCNCTVLRLQLDDFRGLMGHDASLERDLQAAVAQQLYTSMGEQRRTLLVVPGQEENAGGAGTDDTAGVPKKICKEPSWDFSMQRGTLINRSRRLSTTLGGSVVATSNSPEGSGPEWMVDQRREAGPDSDERATSQEFSPGRGSVEEREIPDHILEKDDIAGALGEDLNKDKNTAIMIWLGILIDAIPESMVIGFIVSRGSRNPLVFVVGVFLSNFPEALASAATMKQVGLSVLTIMSLWTSTFIVTGVGALIGAAIMPERDDAGQFELFVKGMEGLAAGAMLTMIAQTMLPEACEKGGAGIGVCCLCGFLAALLTGLIPF